MYLDSDDSNNDFEFGSISLKSMTETCPHPHGLKRRKWPKVPIHLGPPNIMQRACVCRMLKAKGLLCDLSEPSCVPIPPFLLCGLTVSEWCTYRHRWTSGNCVALCTTVTRHRRAVLRLIWKAIQSCKALDSFQTKHWCAKFISVLVCGGSITASYFPQVKKTLKGFTSARLSKS